MAFASTSLCMSSGKCISVALCVSSHIMYARLLLLRNQTSPRALHTFEYALNSRQYFEIIGKDTKKFLQGLLTNDMNLLDGKRNCLAAAVLNPKVTSRLFNMTDSIDS